MNSSSTTCTPQQEEVADPASFEWVALGDGIKPSPGLFVAQVVGESMNKRIPNGSWCLWRLNPEPTQGRVVLVQHNDIDDTDLGSFTLKVYESEKVVTDDGPRLTRVTLKPDSTDPTYQPLVFEGVAGGEVRLIAELVEVLG